MSYLIWIFSISILFAFLMLAYRSYELYSDRNIISLNFRNKTNIFLLKKFYFVLEKVFEINSKIKGFISEIPHKIDHILHSLWRKLSAKVDRYFEKLRARKKDGKKGKVSVYWHRVKGIKDSDLDSNSEFKNIDDLEK